MPLGELIFNLSDGTKKLIRKIEKLNKKLSKAHHAVIFNGHCLNEDILPKYTNFKLHDPATRDKAFTKEFRKKLVQNQLHEKEKCVKILQGKLDELHQQLNSCQIDDTLKREILKALDEKLENCQHSDKTRIAKKLSRIYGGDIKLPERKEGYVNLSSVDLTEAQKDLLNLGLNCHVQSKRSNIDKKAELELLYRDILQLEKENKVNVKQELQDELIGESSRLRGVTHSKVLTPELKEAGRQLRDDERIVVRRADKSPVFVILDKDEYIRKMENILSDEQKFTRISQDPTSKLKAKVNRLIDSANAVIGGVHFSKIVGEFAPGYAYGNVKTHKQGNPLRPIISQVNTPTYKLAKRLNTLLKPYIPTQHSIDSVEEFIDILRAKSPEGELASIDVESLFSNVPIDATIKIILDEVYKNHGDTLPKLQLSGAILEKLLRACTSDAPFRGPNGKLYIQKDGIAMGSPLGPLFANFYMSHVENLVLSAPELAPKTYVRYVDDVMVDVRGLDHLLEIIAELEKNSVLHFTYEMNSHGVLPFLDVLVEAKEGQYVTSVYRKPTNTGLTMHANSECPQRYKRSVVRAFVRRALRTCSNYELLHAEFNRTKQLLINNGYSNSEVDSEISYLLERHFHSRAKDSDRSVCNLYYRNYMNSAYTTDERTLKQIISRNVKATGENKVRLQIYYKSLKSKNLFMKNNPAKKETLKRTNVVYKFSCPNEDCRLRSVDYIGVTTTTLSRRLTMHLADGAPKEHMEREHNTQLTRRTLTQNTTIIASTHDTRKLGVLEALLILEQAPILNRQVHQTFTLTLWNRGTRRGEG